ncbi:MAG: DNA polymerase IV [Rhodothermales bacterium]|nr:DNA polymerase IV [Rhodothermales bacterium]
MIEEVFRRRIIHVDMDAFYASVEQRDNADLRGKPVAVGGSSRRGVVAAASYEARKFGVRSAMPSITAARKCPSLIFVRPRFDVYTSISRQIREIFAEYTPLVEPLSLDEAYLDVTTGSTAGRTATQVANEIRERIFEETQLTASAGVSFNKFLAKVASDFNKPNGITVVRPDQVEAFVGRLPIERFFGVGKVTARKFKKMGVRNGEELRQMSIDDLTRRFGKLGPYYYRLARGIDERKVRTNRRRKSIGAERTYFDDTDDRTELRRRLTEVLDRLWPRIEKAEAAWRTVTIKIKYHDFVQSTRSRSSVATQRSRERLTSTAFSLLETPELPARPVRLLGASVSNLVLPGDPVDAEEAVDPQLLLEL